ncbi:MAG: WD40/YVTN/BNR-like repeat-containing protein, partial [Planctomycetota bacterium]
TIAVAQGDSDIIWIGHNDGSLYRSPNGTAVNPVWVKSDVGRPNLPNRWVSRIAIDPRDHQRVYVSMMGYESNNLWRTLDNGANWTQITGTAPHALPNSPVAAIAVHPTVSGVLVAGTDLGIYWSLDDGNSWTTSSAGPGNASVEELLWRNDDELYVVTHGRGIYKSTFAFDAAVSEQLGQGCGLSGSPSLDSTSPEVGSTLQFDLSGASANSPVVLLLSSGAPDPLDLGMGCTLQVPVGSSYVFRSGLTDGLGNISFNVSLVSAADLIGSEYTGQCAVQVNGGPILGVAEISNGLRLVIGL